MTDIPRNFLTNLWILVHTLATYIAQQCENPWEWPSTHEMHSDTAASTIEIQKFAQQMFDLHGHIYRLCCQIRRIYILVSDCKSFYVRYRHVVTLIKLFFRFAAA